MNVLTTTTQRLDHLHVGDRVLDTVGDPHEWRVTRAGAGRDGDVELSLGCLDSCHHERELVGARDSRVIQVY